MMKKKTFGSTLLFTMIASFALGQNLDVCNAILAKGIRNEYQVQTLSTYNSYLREILNYSHEQLRVFIRTGNGSIKVPIPIAEAVLNAELSSASTRQNIDRLRTVYQNDITRTLSTQDAEYVTSSVIDKGILRAWNKCIEDISASQNKINFVITGKDDEIFSITLRYSPDQVEDPDEIVINAITITGGGEIHVPIMMKPMTKLLKYTGYTQKFRRTDPQKEINIQIDFAGRNGVKIEIPSLRPQSFLPVGTIISSVLPWEVFAQHVGDELPYTTKNLWAPCDLRTIRGSELARLGGGPNAPDLRGVFLRGLNKFGSDESETVSVDRKDPTDKRVAGLDFQPDKVGVHDHTYTRNNIGTTGVEGGGKPAAGGFNTGAWITTGNPAGETRPKNIAVYYYIKIN